jgi:hypothetical protein
MNQLTEKIDDLSRKSAEFFRDEEIGEKLTELKEELETRIRRHPVPTIIGAVVAGYILGKLFGGR